MNEKNKIANLTFPPRVLNFIDKLVREDWRLKNRSETMRDFLIKYLDEKYPGWDKEENINGE